MLFSYIGATLNAGFQMKDTSKFAFYMDITLETDFYMEITLNASFYVDITSNFYLTWTLLFMHSTSKNIAPLTEIDFTWRWLLQEYILETVKQVRLYLCGIIN